MHNNDAGKYENNIKLFISKSAASSSAFLPSCQFKPSLNNTSQQVSLPFITNSLLTLLFNHHSCTHFFTSLVHGLLHWMVDPRYLTSSTFIISLSSLSLHLQAYLGTAAWVYCFLLVQYCKPWVLISKIAAKLTIIQTSG